MKNLKMITITMVFFLTLCSQVANSMSESFILPVSESPEEVACSIEIEAEIFCGSIILGSTLNETNYPVPNCPTSSASTGGGLWYELVGEGNNVILSTCNPGTNFDTQIAVFQGDGCEVEDLDCIAGNDDWGFSGFGYTCNYGEGTSAVQFSAEEGIHYFIYITGFASQDGDFELTVTSNSAPLSISCSGNMNRISNNEACNYTVENGEFDPIVTGNCSAVSITNDYNNSETLDGANFPLGNTTVTWTVSNAGGGTMDCSFDVIVEKSDNPSWLSAYTILARKEAKIDQSQVLSGGVGVWDGKAKLKNSLVAGFVKSSNIENSSSTIGTSIYDEANVTLPVFRNNNQSSNQNLKVNDNATKTISAANFLAYKKIEVKKNATLIVNVPELYVKEIKTKDGATIIFNQTTEIMVTKDLKLDKNNTFNSSGQAVYIYTKGKAEVKEGSNFNANIFAKKDIKAKGKSNNLTNMTGIFISDSKVKGEKNTNWNWASGACEWNANNNNNSSIVVNNDSFDDLQPYELTSENDNNISEEKLDELDFKVYPNPANGIAYLDLKQFAGKRVDIVLMDHTAQPVYQQKIDSASDLPHSIEVGHIPNGFYLITIKTEGHDILVKKLMITNN